MHDGRLIYANSTLQLSAGDGSVFDSRLSKKFDSDEKELHYTKLGKELHFTKSGVNFSGHPKVYREFALHPDGSAEKVFEQNFLV